MVVTHYQLCASDLWGDYGMFLMSGMYESRDENGCIALMRTGPFVPPISFPSGEVVVTDDFRSRYERSGLRGLTFRPVTKRLIVEYHWEHWDRQSDKDLRLPNEPDGGEVEDYVIGQPHSQEASDAMGTLWEACMERVVEAAAVNERKPWDYDVAITAMPKEALELDFFRPKTFGWLFVSARAKQWLEKVAGEWVSFAPVLSQWQPP